MGAEHSADSCRTGRLWHARAYIWQCIKNGRAVLLLLVVDTHQHANKFARDLAVMLVQAL